ncbi:MAG: hypothetical protein K2Y14_12940 [Burkholderiales bacterium]|nr:hypothetical protein [Burkholderiales bacterium]
MTFPLAKGRVITHRELIHERLWPPELVKFFLVAHQDKAGNLCYLYDDVIKSEKHLDTCSLGLKFKP